MNNTFARAATQKEIDEDMRRSNIKSPYFEQAAAPTTTSANLRGGAGGPVDSRGDAFASAATLAARRN